MQFIPKKLYYKIGEVCEIVGVEAHVLRFWETEFPSLSPRKSKSGQRIYRPKDIELLLRIRRLLYEEGFTIAGARRQMAAERQEGPARAVQPAPEVAEAVIAEEPADPEAERLKKVKAELENILTLLHRE